MTKLRFARCWACALIVVAFAASPASAQTTQSTEPASKPGKPINAGDVLSGELTAMRVKGGGKGKKVATYQITSEPRRLPAPSGLCNLETGPETFALVTSSDAQAAQLKGMVGKPISIKVEEVSCAQDAGQWAEAVVTKWSMVRQ